jgi:hypothetical protein
MPAAAGHGHLRVAHFDREQVIGVLKAAFVQGMLGKEEFDLRVGRAFASRTWTELDALTADLPSGLTATKTPQAARAQGEPRIPRPGVVLTVATVVYAAVWLVAFLLPRTARANPQGTRAGRAARLVLLVSFARRYDPVSTAPEF